MRLKFPGLIDIETVSSAQDILELSDHPSLDRDLERNGPYFNRRLLQRILSTFHADDQLLPGFRSRDDTERAEKQRLLKAQLDKLAEAAEFDQSLLSPAISYVASRSGSDVDQAMESICVLLAMVFNENFQADGKTELWRQAKIIQRSVRPLSLRGLIDRLSGKNLKAREAILKSVGRKSNGLHAIAITTANIRETLVKMRDLRNEYNQKNADNTQSKAVNPGTKEGFWLLVRVAPETLFRRVRATLSLPTSGNILTRDTLIILRARKGQRSEPTLGYAFLDKGWSACPASAYVPALCWFIWTQAFGKDGGQS